MRDVGVCRPMLIIVAFATELQIHIFYFDVLDIFEAGV